MNEVAQGKLLVLFDSDCLMCQGTTRALHKLDNRNRLLFAPLKGETAERYSVPDVDSIVVVDQGQVLVKSDAIVRLLKEVLPAVGHLATLIPKHLRDRVYDFIAQRRHKISRITGPSSKAECDLPPKGFREKVLP